MEETWIKWFLGLVITTIIIPTIVYFIRRYQYNKNRLHELKIDLKENLSIAQEAKPFSEYSLQGQEFIKSSSSKLSEDIVESISKLYRELKINNKKINQVPVGYWRDSLFKQYYADCIQEIEMILTKIE